MKFKVGEIYRLTGTRYRPELGDEHGYLWVCTKRVPGRLMGFTSVATGEELYFMRPEAAFEGVEDETR
jgi:hypothetical protein